MSVIMDSPTKLPFHLMALFVIVASVSYHEFNKFVDPQTTAPDSRHNSMLFPTQTR